MTITIVGMGYVGLTAAAIFANAGHTVYAVEVDQERLQSLKERRSFFHEENLDPLIDAGMESGLLIPTDSLAEAVPASEIIFSCVGTPDNPDGSSNLSFVFTVAHEVAQLAGTEKKIFVQKSTVPVGTGQTIIQLFIDQGANLSYVSNPEFQREGTAVVDSLWFDRIVVGGEDPDACQAVISLYKNVTSQRGNIAARADIDTPPSRAITTGEYITTSVNSAELIKVTANAFLATKITFANSIAKLADAADADIVEVMNGVGADPRIGRSFLNAGRGYGGGCFPKDISGLISSGIEYGVELDILHAVSSENESMVGYIIEKAVKLLGGSLVDKEVTILGLSFKAGTSDIRRSPAVRMANLLTEQRGVSVRVHDPVVLGSADSRRAIAPAAIIHESLEDAIRGSDAVFVATDWQEFTALSARTYKDLMGGDVFVDCMNAFSPDTIRAAGLTYVGVGR